MRPAIACVAALALAAPADAALRVAEYGVRRAAALHWIDAPFDGAERRQAAARAVRRG